MKFVKKPVLTPGNPGAWESRGSLSKARYDALAFLTAANDLKNQLQSGTLDPSSVVNHAKKLRRHLDILEQHGLHPTKYNDKKS